MQPCSHETKVIPQYCASMRVTGLYVICYLWAVCYLLLAACAAPSIKISTNCCLFSSSNTVLLQGKKAIRLSTTGWIIYWLWFMYFTTTSSSSLEIQLPILRYLVPSGTKKSRHSHNEFSQLFPRLADTWHVSWSWHRCSDCWHLNHHGSHKDGIVLLASHKLSFIDFQQWRIHDGKEVSGHQGRGESVSTDIITLFVLFVFYEGGWMKGE